jgi:hypothetical protein
MYNVYNISIISILTILYIMLILKLSDILNEEDKENMESQSVTIYFLSIIGFLTAYLCFSNTNINGNLIVNKSLNIGSVLLLIYIMCFHWNDLKDYYKLSLLAIAFIYMIYLVYN